MSCSIPNFNLDFSARYDLSTVIPTVTITNLSTGDNLANIDYFFVLTTPSGTVYHTGSFGSPDASGVWATLAIAEPIPQSGGHVEFSNIPYSIVCYAKDNLGNLCDLTKLDIIAPPIGNNGKNNWGLIALNIAQKCLQGLLEIIDVTNYVWNSLIGVLQSNETVMVYPADETGAAIDNFTTTNKNAFSIPIPINGKGYQLFRNAIQLYTFPSGNEILIKYKYQNDCLEINCNISLCSVLCGLTKYRNKLTNSTSGQCSGDDQKSINDLTLKVAQLSIALTYPACGFDANALYLEIKEELFKNDCYCDCPDNTGNNDTTGLECSGIDIACVWNQIYNLLQTDSDEKDKFCTVVTQCVEAMDAGECAQPFMSNVVFSPTLITVNFNLNNQANSTSLKVYYKLHTDPGWTLAATLASNATTYDIVGVFTEGELYDVYVVNTCSVGGPTDSVIITGTIPVTLDACYYLDLIYSGLGDGMYGVLVDNSLIGCAKFAPTIIDANYIASLLPCSAALNARINESAFLEWTGDAGDWTLSYKLKVDIAWTTIGTQTYAGTDHDEDLSGLLLSPLSDYEFRIVHNCTAGDSLPVYCDYVPVISVCPSAGDFISFDETTGALVWRGNGTALASYVFSALSGGVFLGTPLSVALSAANNIITADYSNILASLGVGDEVNFAVYQDCGGGSVSDIQSHQYLMIGTTATCPDYAVATLTVISTDLVEVTNTGTIDPLINQVQYELQVNTVFAGTGVLDINGNGYVTQIKSLIPIVNGDSVRIRFKSFCACCENNVTSNSAWSGWTTEVAGIVVLWDDIWVAIPGGWYLNGASAGPDGAFYKIDKDGNFHLRGIITTNTAVAAGTNNYSLDFLDISAVYSSLNADTLSAGDTDFFPMTLVSPSPTFVAAEQAIGRYIRRIDDIFRYDYSTTSVAGTADVPTFGISHLRIV